MAAVEKKKSKKKNATTVSLADFLNKSSAGSTSTPRYPSAISVDNTEDQDRNGSSPWKKMEKVWAAPINRSALPTAPRCTRESDIDRSRLPSGPPYTAFLGNLPYDVSEDSIKEFFHGLAIGAVRLPREPSTPERLKGFGYVEFDDKESLLKALNLHEENLGNRRIRVDIADDKERDSGPMGRRDQVSRMSDMGPDMTDSNWRTRPTGDNVNDGPPKRDNAFGDRSSNRYDPTCDRRDRYDNRGAFDSRSGVGSRAYGNGNRRYNDDKPSYGNQDRYGADHEDRYERRDERQRPKLNLKPCSIPKEEEQGGGGATLSPSSGTRSSSIFGGAKPVDTAAREREMEERLKKEQERLQRQQEEDGGRRPDRRPRDRDPPSWRSSPTAGRGERSHTGNGSTQPGSSSGRGLPCHESECSVKNEEEFSGREDEPSSPSASPCPPSDASSKEPLKAMPAPPPKKNAWAKRSAVTARASDGHGQPPPSAPPKFSSSSSVEVATD